MSCCCCPASNHCQAKKRATVLRILTCIFLPLISLLLYHSIIDDSPWFHLTVNPHTTNDFLGHPVVTDVHNLDDLAVNFHNSTISVAFSLRSVNISISSPRSSHVIIFNDLIGDYFTIGALTITGLYESILEIKFATEELTFLGNCVLVACCVAFLIHLLFLTVSCIKKIAGIFHVRDSDLSIPLVQDQNNPINQRSEISTFPYLVIGSISLIAGECALLGFVLWLQRSLPNATKIILRIGKLVGHHASQWLESHTNFYPEYGLLEYVSAAVLLLALSLFNIFSNFRVKSSL